MILCSFQTGFQICSPDDLKWPAPSPQRSAPLKGGMGHAKPHGSSVRHFVSFWQKEFTFISWLGVALTGNPIIYWFCLMLHTEKYILTVKNLKTVYAEWDHLAKLNAVNESSNITCGSILVLSFIFIFLFFFVLKWLAITHYLSRIQKFKSLFVSFKGISLNDEGQWQGQRYIK